MAVKAHINVILTGTHLNAFQAFATRVTEDGVKDKTPDVMLALVETLPEFEKLTGIKSEYGKNPQRVD